MAALIAIQQPQLFNGFVFSAPALLPAVGFILVRTSILLYVQFLTIMVCMLQRGLTRAIAAIAPQLQVRRVDPNTISRIPEEVLTCTVHVLIPQ